MRLVPEGKVSPQLGVWLRVGIWVLICPSHFLPLTVLIQTRIVFGLVSLLPSTFEPLWEASFLKDLSFSEPLWLTPHNLELSASICPG